MAIIHGTNAAEKILPGFTSPGVTGGRPTIDADTIFAAGGNDVVRGGLGVDNAFLGGGDDRYIWNLGDGNDVVGGGVGIDTLDIRGSGAQTLFELFSDGLYTISSSFKKRGGHISSAGQPRTIGSRWSCPCWHRVSWA